VRAPALRRASAPQWDKAEPIFSGRDLAGWHVLGTNEWEADNGILRNKKSGGNLVTDAKFTDFKLHVEFRYPAGGNSGIYLRGRYEVQVADTGDELEVGSLGAVYGFLEPSDPAAKKPGEWQTFDVTLVGRMITVVLNGTTIISNREIPGPTGAALDSDEGAPGPLLLQGDHTAIEYRNITIARGR
jgi:3-keto-disaccharide hydrolase